MSIEKLDRIYGVTRPSRHEGLITNGTIQFGVADNTTTEKFSTGIDIVGVDIHPDGIFALVAEHPGVASAGYMLVNVYNADKIDTTNERDVLLMTGVLNSASAVSASTFMLQGAGIGQGSMKFGIKFQANSVYTLNCAWKLYRL